MDIIIYINNLNYKCKIISNINNIIKINTPKIIVLQNNFIFKINNLFGIVNII